MTDHPIASAVNIPDIPATTPAAPWQQVRRSHATTAVATHSGRRMRAPALA